MTEFNSVGSESRVSEEPDLFDRIEEDKGKKKFPFFKIIFVLGILFASLNLIKSQPWMTCEGTLKARNMSQINIPASGVFSGINHRKGDTVMEGEVLASIESPDLKRALGEKEMELTSISHDLKQLSEEQKFLEKELERQRILLENGAVAKAVLDAAEYMHQAKRETLLLKAKEEETAKSGLSLLRMKIDSLTLKAPISGIVIKDSAEKQGGYLREGEALFEIADPSSFYMEVPVKEKSIQKIHIGDKASVSFDAISHESFGGEVMGLNPNAEEKVEKVFKVNQVVNCEIKLEGLPKDARYGMKARIKIWPRGRANQNGLFPGIQDFKGKVLNQNLLSALSGISNANSDTNEGMK